MSPIPARIGEFESDTREKIENMKVMYELVLRTQQSVASNDAKVKELHAQLVGERKTLAMHEKVRRPLGSIVHINTILTLG